MNDDYPLPILKEFAQRTRSYALLEMLDVVSLHAVSDVGVCVCVCVCMYVCIMPACMYLCMHLCIHSCVYVCMCVCTDRRLVNE
jgi:hypothetical protein